MVSLRSKYDHIQTVMKFLMSKDTLCAGDTITYVLDMVSQEDETVTETLRLCTETECLDLDEASAAGSGLVIGHLSLDSHMGLITFYRAGTYTFEVSRRQTWREWNGGCTATTSYSSKDTQVVTVAELIGPSP